MALRNINQIKNSSRFALWLSLQSKRSLFASRSNYGESTARSSQRFRQTSVTDEESWPCALIMNP
jgi:hypothetical protein